MQDHINPNLPKSEKNDLNSVRLSTLNVDLRSKIAKFDTNNEGELSIDDLIHAIVTLQKQSNNYKRILYIVFPIMLIMIASIFGTTMLALNLTKEIKMDSNGLLVNARSNNIVTTGQTILHSTFQEWIQSENPEDLRNIHSIEFENMILPVQTTYINQTVTVFMLEFMYISVDRINESIHFDIKKIYENDTYVQNFVNDLQQKLISSKVQFSAKWGFFDFLTSLFTIQTVPKNLPGPAGAVKPICSPAGICSSPKTL